MRDEALWTMEWDGYLVPTLLKYVAIVSNVFLIGKTCSFDTGNYARVLQSVSQAISIHNTRCSIKERGTQKMITAYELSAVCCCRVSAEDLEYVGGLQSSLSR